MKKLMVIGAVATLSGCANFTGLDAKADFACAAPEGVSCSSMAGVYANMGRASTSAKSKNEGEEEYAYLGGTNYAERNKAGTDQYGRRPMTYSQTSGIPIRTQPQIMKIWLAPWQSQDRTFYDQSYAYIVVNHGDWILAHNRNNIIDEYAPVTQGVVGSGTSRVVEIPAVNNIGISGNNSIDMFGGETMQDSFDDLNTSSSNDSSFNDVSKPLVSGYSMAKKPTDLAEEIKAMPEAFGKQMTDEVSENLMKQYSIETNGQ